VKKTSYIYSSACYLIDLSLIFCTKMPKGVCNQVNKTASFNILNHENFRIQVHFLLFIFFVKNL